MGVPFPKVDHFGEAMLSESVAATPELSNRIGILMLGFQYVFNHRDVTAFREIYASDAVICRGKVRASGPKELARYAHMMFEHDMELGYINNKAIEIDRATRCNDGCFKVENVLYFDHLSSDLRTLSQIRLHFITRMTDRKCEILREREISYMRVWSAP